MPSIDLHARLKTAGLLDHLKKLVQKGGDKLDTAAFKAKRDGSAWLRQKKWDAETAWDRRQARKQEGVKKADWADWVVRMTQPRDRIRAGLGHVGAIGLGVPAALLGWTGGAHGGSAIGEVLGLPTAGTHVGGALGTMGGINLGADAGRAAVHGVYDLAGLPLRRRAAARLRTRAPLVLGGGVLAALLAKKLLGKDDDR